MPTLAARVASSDERAGFGRVSGKLERSELTELPSTPEIVAWFNEHVGSSGHDPIEAVVQAIDL